MIKINNKLIHQILFYMSLILLCVAFMKSNISFVSYNLSFYALNYFNQTNNNVKSINQRVDLKLSELEEKSYNNFSYFDDNAIIKKMNKVNEIVMKYNSYYVDDLNNIESILNGNSFFSTFEYKEIINYENINIEDYYDKIYFRNYLYKNDKNKIYLSIEDVCIYDQSDKAFSKRRKLTHSDLEVMKLKIDQYNNDFTLETEKMLLRVKEKNKKIIEKLIVYLEKDKNLNQFVSQLKYVFFDENNYVVADEVILELIETAQSMNNKLIFSDMIKYLNREKHNILSLDRENKNDFNDNLDISSYSLIYTQEKIFLNNVKAIHQFIFPDKHFSEVIKTNNQLTNKEIPFFKKNDFFHFMHIREITSLDSVIHQVSVIRSNLIVISKIIDLLFIILISLFIKNKYPIKFYIITMIAIIFIIISFYIFFDLVLNFVFVILLSTFYLLYNFLTRCKQNRVLE